MKVPQATTFLIIGMTLIFVGMFELCVTLITNTMNVWFFSVPLMLGALSQIIATELIRRDRKKQ